MPYVQKDVGMGMYDVSVQINDAQEFQLIPENPHVLQVDMPFLLFVTPNQPNIQINHPVNTVIYRVEDDNGALVVEQYPIAT